MDSGYREKIALSLRHKFDTCKQKKEADDITKGKTEPSLSPAVIRVRPESDFPSEANTYGIILMTPGKLLRWVLNHQQIMLYLVKHWTVLL